MHARRAVVSVLVAGLGFAASPRGQASGALLGPGVREALEGAARARVVVAFREPRASAAQLALRAAEIGNLRSAILADLRPGDFEATHRWDLVPGMAGWITARGLERLLSDPDVTHVDLDTPAAAHMAEAVPLVHADEVTGMGVTGRGVTVAVLDTGVDTDHPDFSGRIVDQACFCTSGGGGCCPGGGSEAKGPGSAEDDNGHGTNVAGIIVGGGSVAPRGMAPDATLVAIKVLDRSGSGASSSIVSALDYVLKSRPEVKVVNMSLGLSNLFPGTCDNAAAFTTGFASAINALRARGTITFASSGNSANPGQIAVPGCIAAAVAVGAVYDGEAGSITLGCTDSTTAADRVACFSNSSSAVDLLAPGAPSTSSGVNGGAITFVGTSQACPAAAGAAALLLSANSGAGPDRVEQALKETGVSVTDPRNGLTFRRINVRAAVDRVR
jgi:subtilisin family serine protease